MSYKVSTAKSPFALSIPAVKLPTAHSVFDALPDSAFIREAQLVQSPKRPDVPAPLPFSSPTLWRMVGKGLFPKPIKISSRVTCWKVSEVRAWMAAQASAKGSTIFNISNNEKTFPKTDFKSQATNFSDSSAVNAEQICNVLLTVDEAPCNKAVSVVSVGSADGAFDNSRAKLTALPDTLPLVDKFTGDLLPLELQDWVMDISAMPPSATHNMSLAHGRPKAQDSSKAKPAHSKIIATVVQANETIQRGAVRIKPGVKRTPSPIASTSKEAA